MKDPLHDRSEADVRWTGINTAENFPDVATPLGWTFWEVPLELGLRGAFCDLGVLTPAQVTVAEKVDDRFSGVFYGRFTTNLNMLLAMADLMPGASGKAFEEQMFGGARTWAGRPSKRRWPVVLVKRPATAFRLPGRLRGLRAETGAWWRSVTAPGALDDPARAREVLREAMRHFERVMRPHTVCTMVGQVAYEQVAKLAARAGEPGLEIQLITGSGTLEETTLAGELWELSRGTRELGDFLARHGYHGPSEADVAGLSWREDPTPVVRLAETYRSMPDDAAPPVALREQAARREVAERRLRAGLSGPARLLGARVLAGRLLNMARTFLPLREVGKATFLQAIDGGRAAARALGTSLAAEGVLDRPEDIQYLTVEEVLGQPPSDVAAVVIDMGGPLSHGAIIARELGIPCVINTRGATRQLHSGQRIRVDGSARVVEVLSSEATP